MNEEHRKVLTSSLREICKDLDAELVLPHLVDAGILQDVHAEVIKAIVRRDSRNMELVSYVKQGGPLAFEEFIFSLQENGKEPLANQILARLSPAAMQIINNKLQDRKGRCDGQPDRSKSERIAIGAFSGIQQLTSKKQASSASRKFDVLSAADDIINKFNHFPKEKQKKLKIPLDHFLKSTFEDCCTELCQSLHVTDLVNDYLSSVLPPSVIMSIKTKYGGDATFELFNAVANSNSLLVLMTFIVGLQKTKQEHLFHLFFTEAFFNKFSSVLEEYDTD